jgi:hypothetical protein
MVNGLGLETGLMMNVFGFLTVTVYVSMAFQGFDL